MYASSVFINADFLDVPRCVVIMSLAITVGMKKGEPWSLRPDSGNQKEIRIRLRETKLTDQDPGSKTITDSLFCGFQEETSTSDP